MISSAFVTSVPPTAHFSQRSSWYGLTSRRRPFSAFLSMPLRSRLPAQGPSTNPRLAPVAVFSGGGFLGVGPAEIVVIVAVGWLLLGPEKLYSLARDTGKVLGSLRSSADQARETFSDALEMELIDADRASKEKKSTDTEKIATGTESEMGAETTTPAAAGLSPNTAHSEEENETDPALADLLRKDAAVAAADDKVFASPAAKGPEPVDPALNSAFLDQLRRVADTNQVAPSEAALKPEDGDIPGEISMDAATDEELEVERLERQYMEAKRKLEERRRQSKPAGTDTSDV